MVTRTLRAVNRPKLPSGKRRDGKWGRCPTCGQFLSAVNNDKHFQHGRG